MIDERGFEGPHGGGDGPAGFSLLEVLITGLLLTLLLVSAMGMTAAAARAGQHAEVSRTIDRLAASRLAELAALSWKGSLLELPEGAEELVRRERWTSQAQGWVNDEEHPLDVSPRFSSEIRVRDFAVSALRLGQRFLEDDERLTGEAGEPSRQLKEIRVLVWLGDGSAAPDADWPQSALRLVRAF